MEIKWIQVGDAKILKEKSVSEVSLGNKKIAVSYRNGKWGAILGVCMHVGGPLGQGTLEGDYIVCPWHQWKLHRCTGKKETL